MKRLHAIVVKTKNKLTNALLLPVLFCLFIMSCTNKPYELVDGYIYQQKAERSNNPGQWQLVWADEFNENELDESKWTRIDAWNDIDFKHEKADWIKDPERWKNLNNINCFSYTTGNKDLYDFKNGNLHLWGIVNKDKDSDPRPFLQGAVKSKGKFAFKYGRLEIRAKLQGAEGAWPAFWMLAEKEIYEKLPNRNGEIDIMERLNHDDFVYQTTHSYWTIGMKNKMNPPGYSTSNIDSDNYNVYGIEWYPDKIVYTVNGTINYVYPKLKDVDACQWPFDQPFYVMLDQQLGGTWVGQVNPKDLPAVVEIDWIRLYQ